MSIQPNENVKKSNSMLPTPDNNFESIAHQAGKKVGSMASGFANTTSHIADSAAGYMKSGREYVTQNPASGVAIAAAVGVACGSLLTMALRSSRKV